MIRRVIVICAAALSGGLSFNVVAISIEPGQWEMNYVMNMPMLSQPQTRTHTECVKESEYGPEDLQMDESYDCELKEVEDSGDSLSFIMDCDTGDGGTSRFEWALTSNGDSMEGNGTMSASMGGHSMQMTMEWSGRRLGDCAE